MLMIDVSMYVIREGLLTEELLSKIASDGRRARGNSRHYREMASNSIQLLYRACAHCKKSFGVKLQTTVKSPSSW